MTSPTPSAVRGGHRTTGLLIACVGVLVISPDILLVRLAQADEWTIVFWRGAFTGVAIMAVAAVVARLQGTRLWTDLVGVGRPGALIALVSGASHLLIVISVTHTHAANTIVILSATPVFAAALSSIFLADRVPPATWAAALVAFLGIAAVFWGSVRTTGEIGDIAALGSALLAASNLTLSRANRTRPLLPALALGGFIAAVAAVAAAPATVGTIGARDLLWLGLNGLVVLPIGLSLVLLAPRYIPPADVAVVFLLEGVLGPIWVWLAVHEAPRAITIVGGVILLVTVTVHTWYQARLERVCRLR